jgi:hypothetical protein
MYLHHRYKRKAGAECTDYIFVEKAV